MNQNKHLNTIVAITAEAYGDAYDHNCNMDDSPWEMDLMDRLEADFYAKERACTVAHIHDELLER